MTDQPAAPLASLESAIVASKPDRATHAVLDAVRSKVPMTEVVRTAARTFAAYSDAGAGSAPRAIAALSSALNLFPVLQSRFHPLPVLQAVSFAATEKKAPDPAKPSAVVSGEVTHLGRSFLFGVRSGNLAEAEPIFLGMLAEGRERKMAGDILFRAAIEDMGEGGRKLFVAVKSWQLARSLGFKESHTILRPAVEYLVKGPRDRTAYESILSALGRRWVDLDGLASGGRPLDDEGRAKVLAITAAPSDSSCVQSTLALLEDGYAASSIAEGFAVDAARRIIASSGYDKEAARRFLFAHASRFVLTFSRTSERLYALFQAALRLRSAEPSPELVPPAAAATEGEELCHIAGEFDARKPREAAGRIRAYVARGYSTPRMLDVLANYACRDASRANEAFNLLLADACAAEFLAAKAPAIPMALAKMIAASPKDQAAYETWAPLFST